MKIKDVLRESEKFDIYENKNLVKSTIDKIKKLSWSKAKKILQGGFRYLNKFAKDKGIEKQVLNIINKMLGKQYRNLNDLMKISLMLWMQMTGKKPLPFYIVIGKYLKKTLAFKI